MLEKQIKFYPIANFSEDAIPYPSPASQFIPEWYRNMPSHISDRHGARAPQNNIHVSNLTVKRCMPFFDALTGGYVVTTPCDILFVDPAEFGYRAIWTVSYNVVGTHGKEQVLTMPMPDGYEEILKWQMNFRIETPKGYSCMFMHPNFLYDSPFLTIPAIVDTDTHPIEVNFPFFLKKGFMGKVEKGTPICQIFPFKRESWKMTKEKFSEKEKSRMDFFHSVMEKSYRNRFWSRKSYK